MANVRHYFEPFDNGGALIRPQRVSSLGAYELKPAMRQRARNFILSHAEDFNLSKDEDLNLVLDMLGLIDE